MIDEYSPLLACGVGCIVVGIAVLYFLGLFALIGVCRELHSYGEYGNVVLIVAVLFIYVGAGLIVVSWVV